MGADPARRRIVLIGMGPTTRSAFDGLVDSFEIDALIRDADDEVASHALHAGVAVRADTSLAAVRRAIEELKPDAVVVSSYNRILDVELVERCPFVNVHYAPLPRGRGRATVNWAIIRGDPEAAISIHRLVAGLDSGGILFQQAVPIGPRSTVTSLYAELNALQQTNIADAVADAIAGDPGAAQDESDATYLCTRTPDDGEIDWASSTVAIDRLIRALQDPYPPAYTWLGLDRVEIIEAVPVESPPTFDGRIPGRIVRIDRTTGEVDVLTGDGVLRLARVRPQSEPDKDAASVLTSVQLTLGLQMRDVADIVRRVQSQVDRGST